MIYTLLYSRLAFEEDKPGLSPDVLFRLERAIQSKLLSEPQRFAKPLKNVLKNHWSLRVGDYRILFKIDETTIKILALAHRKDVYQIALKRLVRS